MNDQSILLYEAMLAARNTLTDEEADHLHPEKTHRVGAALILADGTLLTSSNLFLKELLDEDDDPLHFKIGNASPTIHAEVALLIKAIDNGLHTEGASLLLTDAPCPNCMKMLIAAGISNIYIDAAGFERKGSWYDRRGEYFDHFSKVLAAENGVSIYRIESDDYLQAIRKPEIINSHVDPSGDLIEDSADEIKLYPSYDEKRDYVAYEQDISERFCGLAYLVAPTVEHDGTSGFVALTERFFAFRPSGSLPDPNKYTDILHPLNHLIAICARHGSSFDDGSIALYYPPSPRELMNFYWLHSFFPALKLSCVNAPFNMEAELKNDRTRGSIDQHRVDAYQFFASLDVIEDFPWEHTRLISPPDDDKGRDQSPDSPPECC